MFLFRFLGLSSANLLTSFSLLFYDTMPRVVNDVVKNEDFKATCRKGNKEENNDRHKKELKHHQIESGKKLKMLTFAHSPHDEAEIFFIKVTIIFFTVSLFKKLYIIYIY